MTEETVSPWRRRMIEDMTIRRFTEKTQADYIRRVETFADFLGTSLARASAENVRRWHLQLTASGASVSRISAAVSALRFFYKVTLGRLELIEQMPFLREPQRLPEVLSPDEAARLLRAWWKVGRPSGWLLFGRDPVHPITTRAPRRTAFFPESRHEER